MKLVYEAANSIEAHMVLNMLEQEGIEGRIDGEFLQGGIGDLPAGGLIRVMVQECDYERARAIVQDWDAAQPEPPARAAPLAPSAGRGANVLLFAAGLAIGLLCSYFYARAPVHTQGLDHNGDGTLDEVWSFTRSGTMSAMRADRNFDGRYDFVLTYDDVGAPEQLDSDDDFDGIFESVLSYKRGNPGVLATDTDKDSFADLRTQYADGVVATVEHINPGSGMPQKIDYFKLGKLTHSDVDSDVDGKMDTRVRYDVLGQVQSTEQLKP